MKRNAEVALTATNKENVNRLRVPDFGVLKLCVQTDKSASKSYLPEGAPKPKEADKGMDDFHFAPEKEAIKIFYEVDNIFGMVEKAKLELFCRFKKDPLWTL